jgi:NAD dependent epimerase/dehydratase family enzyme
VLPSSAPSVTVQLVWINIEDTIEAVQPVFKEHHIQGQMDPCQ